MLLFDSADVVRADLVAQAAAPAVDEDDDLVLSQPERFGNVVVEHVGDALDFEEMVPRAEAPELVHPAVFGLLRDELRTGVGSAPLVLAVSEVGFGGVALLERPLHPPFQYALDGVPAAVDDAAAAETRGNGVE